MVKLTGSSTKHLVRPGTGRSDDGVEGDLRRRRTRARSVRWTRATRAHGARLARRRGGWRSSWTRQHGVGLTEGVATARGWRRWRRPWRGTRETGVGGEWRCPGGSRLDVEFIHPATRRGGEQVRGTHVVLAVEHLACLPGRQAAHWRGSGLGRQVGRVAGAR